MSEPSSDMSVSTKHPPNSYWGFGWIGRIGMLVVVMLVAATVAGADPSYVLCWIWSRLPTPFDELEFARRLVVLRMQSRNIEFTIWTSLFLIPVISWWPAPLFRRMVAILGILVCAALATLFYQLIVTRQFPIHLGWIQILNRSILASRFISWLLISMIMLTCVAYLARAWSITGALVVITMLGGLANLYGLAWMIRSIEGQTALLIGWNVLLVGTVMLGALRAHLGAMRQGFCSSCSYDLIGLESVRACPECGEEAKGIVRPAD